MAYRIDKITKIGNQPPSVETGSIPKDGGVYTFDNFDVDFTTPPFAVVRLEGYPIAAPKKIDGVNKPARFVFKSLFEERKEVFVVTQVEEDNP